MREGQREREKERERACERERERERESVCVCVRVCVYVCVRAQSDKSARYGVATMSRLLKIIGLFCKRALQKRRYSAKESYDFKKPTNRSHPISAL